jgi:hypothetical protein
MDKGKPKVHGTLVLVGELSDGELHVRGMWREGPPEWENEVGRYGGWSDEALWLAGLNSFRENGEVSKELGKKVSQPRGIDNFMRTMARLAHPPLDKPRFWGVLLRGLLFPAFIAGACISLSYLIDNQWWSWAIRFAMPTLCVIWSACVFVFIEAGLLLYWYPRLRRSFARAYEQPLRVVSLSPAESQARLDHPWASKYSAELEEAGFRQAGDFRLEPEVFGNTAVRVFFAPDGVTYVHISFSMTSDPDPEQAVCIWPATICFFARTFFTDGACVASTTDRLGSCRKKRTGPEHRDRVILGEADIIGFVRQHQESVEQFTGETGRSPMPHMAFGPYLQRQNSLNDLERELYEHRPYTWGDHWHWYFQWPRRELRGNAARGPRCDDDCPRSSRPLVAAISAPGRDWNSRR